MQPALPKATSTQPEPALVQCRATDTAFGLPLGSWSRRSRICPLPTAPRSPGWQELAQGMSARGRKLSPELRQSPGPARRGGKQMEKEGGEREERKSFHSAAELLWVSRSLGQGPDGFRASIG